MPRNKYPEETVQKILDASLTLFLEKGYEQTTILDIVNNLGGLTRGAFYHHFKSKEEVLEALSGKLFEENNPFDHVKSRTDLTGLEKVREVMLTNVSPNKNEDLVALNKVALPLLANPRFLALHLKGNEETAKLFEPLIEEGIADGSIGQGSARLLSELLMVLFNFWMIPAIFPGDAQDFEDKSMMIRKMLDSVGFPLMNDAVWEKGDEYADLLGIDPT